MSDTGHSGSTGRCQVVQCKSSFTAKILKCIAGSSRRPKTRNSAASSKRCWPRRWTRSPPHPSRGTTASANRRVRPGHDPRSRMMAARREPVEAPANRLLGLLPAADYRRLSRHLERMPLTYRQSLYRASQPLGFVYFIETGVGSLVNTMANGQAAEVGTIGNEGVVGLPLLLGDDRAPTSVYVQVPGAGLRMTAARFSRELAESASMRTVMLRYAHALFNQVAQSATC